jgi:RNA polymerase sigma factor (sigma-70 family)
MGSLSRSAVIAARAQGSLCVAAPQEDVELARRAAAGDGGAFATLYDRHERRAYNLCYRITGSPEDAADATQETFLKVLERLPSLGDRELNFGSYLLSAARNASYDAIERRRRAAPAGEIPDSAVPVAAGAAPDAPDMGALRAAHHEDIRAANALLPPRQREALALRELADLSYDEVADVMGMNRNSVAQLISRARLNLRDGLRRGALVSIPAASPECESALPLLALAQDGALEDDTHADWLARHLAGCATCRVRVEAMEEAGAAYRLWLPLVPGFWLRAKVAKAAERTSARTRLAGRRRFGALAAAGAFVLATAALVAADVVHAPVRAASPAVKAALVVTPTPTPSATPAPKSHVRRHRPAPQPVRVVAHHEPAATPAAVPTATPSPEPVVARERAVRRRPVQRAPKPSAEPAEVIPDDTPVADPPAGGDPPVVTDPPPDDPPGPTCPTGATAAQVPGCPQPPPTGPACGGCTLVAPVKPVKPTKPVRVRPPALVATP